MKKSLYELAGVPPAAPSAVIGMAIKRRLQKLQDSGAPDAAAQAYALREAWSVLGDAKRRAAYDAKLAAEPPKIVVQPATPIPSKPQPQAQPTQRAVTPDEMDLVFVVEEARPPSRIKTYATVAAVLLAFAIGGLWLIVPGSRGGKGTTPAVVDTRTPFAKARGAQIPKPPPPEPTAAPTK